MNKALVFPMAAASLLAVSQVAVSANCLLYDTTMPSRLSQGQQGVDVGALAHTVVVRDAGFKANSIEFMIFPPVLAKQRFSLTANATNSPSGSLGFNIPGATGAPSPLSGPGDYSDPGTQPASPASGFSLPGVSTSIGTPGSPGSVGGTGGSSGSSGTNGTGDTSNPGGTTGTGGTSDTSSPGGTTGTGGASGPDSTNGGTVEHIQTGHVVVMSNTGFYGDLNSKTDPAKVKEIVDAAIDFGTFAQAGNDAIGFTLDPVTATLNKMFVTVQSGTGTETKIAQLPIVQGTIRFGLASDGSAISGDVTLVSVDDPQSPSVQLQYQGSFQGKFVKALSC